MKKKFEEPAVEIITFQPTDVIATSSGDGGLSENVNNPDSGD